MLSECTTGWLAGCHRPNRDNCFAICGKCPRLLCNQTTLTCCEAVLSDITACCQLQTSRVLTLFDAKMLASARCVYVGSLVSALGPQEGLDLDMQYLSDSFARFVALMSSYSLVCTPQC